MRKTSILLAAAVAFVATAAAHAQERAAGQSYDAQTNWGALKSSIDMLINQNKAIADTVDALNTKVTTLTDKVNVLDGKVTTLTSTVNVLNSKVSAIAACGAAGKLWTGAGCAVIFGTPSIEDQRNIQTINNNFGKIASCGAQKMTWNGSACVAASGSRVTVAQVSYSGGDANTRCRNAGYDGATSLVSLYSGGASRSCNGQDCTGVALATPVSVSGYRLYCYKNVAN